MDMKSQTWDCNVCDLCNNSHKIYSKIRWPMIQISGFGKYCDLDIL